MQTTAYNTAVEKGWWEDTKPRTVGDLIALMHSELSEALEEFRAGREPGEIYYSDGGKPEGVGVEMADCIIRILDFAGRYDLDMEALVLEKMAYNAGRPYRHGEKAM